MDGWRVMCVAGVLLAGCAEEQPPMGGPSIDQQGRIWSSSGSRLRPRVLRAPTGLVLPYDVFDSKLEVPCRPRQQTDGSIHCLPEAPWASLDNYFTDAGCSQPLASVGGGEVLPLGTLVAYIITEDCLGKLGGMARLVERVAPGTEVFLQRSSGGSCEARQVSSSDSIYKIDQVRDPPVALTPQRLAMDGRIAARVLVGDDGSHIVTGELHDTVMDAPVLAARTDYLLPTRARWAWAMRRDMPPSDRAEYAAWCQTHGDFLLYNRCEVTRATTHLTLHDPFDPEVAPAVFKVKHQEEAATRCTAGHGVYYEIYPVEKQAGVVLDGPLPEERWVRGNRVEVTDGRLSLMELDDLAQPVAVGAVAVGGRLALRSNGPSTPLQDTQLGVPCKPAPTVDGNTRCLPMDRWPSSVLASPVYLDAGCTQLAARAWRYAAQPPRYMMVNIANPQDPSMALVRVFGVEEPLGDPPIFAPDYWTGECMSRPLEPDYQIFRAGDEIPPETFVPLTVGFR
jgi:hypothetical protein